MNAEVGALEAEIEFLTELAGIEIIYYSQRAKSYRFVVLIASTW